MRSRITVGVVAVAIAALLGVGCGGDDTVDTGNDPGAGTDSGPDPSTSGGGSTETTLPDMSGYGGGY
jgi:hypothetical protein